MGTAKIIEGSNRLSEEQMNLPVVIYRVGSRGNFLLARTPEGRNFSCGEECPGCTGFRYDGSAKIHLDQIGEMEVTKCGIKIR